MVPHSHTQRATFNRFSLGNTLQIISGYVHLYEVLGKALYNILFRGQASPIGLLM